MIVLRKRKFFLPFLFSVFLFVFMAQSVWADTRYVSDQLIISMREERSPEATVVAFLVAGTPVEVLENADDYLFVRIANGNEGWVRSKYILTQRPKAMVIKELQAEINELDNQIKTMEAQADPSSGDASDIRKIYELKLKNLETVLDKEKQSSAATRTELKELKNRNEKLQADVKRLSKQNKSLSKEDDGSETLKNEIARLQQANQALNQELNQMETKGQPSTFSSGIKWFFAGGGVLLLGLFLGKSVPRKNPYGY